MIEWIEEESKIFRQPLQKIPETQFFKHPALGQPNWP